MLATETRNYLRKKSNLCICDNMQSEFLISGIPNDLNNLLVTKIITRPKVSKSYEVIGKSISESFFETSYCEEDIDFINDFTHGHKNGIILIMTGDMSQEAINFFTLHMKDKLKYIIYFNGDASQFNLNNSKGLTFIRTFSLKAAVNTAYRKAKNGQAIVFPQVEQDFDFFEYIDSLN